MLDYVATFKVISIIYFLSQRGEFVIITKGNFCTEMFYCPNMHKYQTNYIFYANNAELNFKLKNCFGK